MDGQEFLGRGSKGARTAGTRCSTPSRPPWPEGREAPNNEKTDLNVVVGLCVGHDSTLPKRRQRLKGDRRQATAGPPPSRRARGS
ncbi:MAG: DUF1847 domain-containing protein [Bacillota bacterium]